jgi:hypothetical protein
MKNYKITSVEGGDHARRLLGDAAVPDVEKAVGTTVRLDLNDDQERALIAAGWLEHDKKEKEATK